MDERERKEIEVFNAALERSAGAERDAYLEQACRDEPALRQKVEALLRVHADAEEFFKEVKDTDTGLAPAGTKDPTPTAVLTPLTEGPGTLIGRYKILEKIGEGGFGTVYVAEQREPVKRRVALKIIKLGMDTKQVVARFEAERQALALMDHPNIAKVLDAGATDTGRPFFVMELVKGIPITKYCEQERTETTERLKLFIQICHAIQHAHQKGIIHRDIKPSNILVTLHDGVPVPKVIDFGIAKATQQELTEKTVYTQFQQFIGTPAYMSPEQAEMSGLDIDTRSDIYSLGVLLYELLTGSTPFDTKELLQSGLDEMRKIIREREPERPSTRVTRELAAQRGGKAGSERTEDGGQRSEVRGQRSAIDSDLDWIVMKCLEKDRTRRYETANGVALDIERHLEHEPVVARPPSVGYRLQKSFRRNRVVFTAAGLVGLALVLGVVVSTWQAIRATRAGRREAEAHVQADQAAQVAINEAERAKAAAQAEARQRERAEASDRESRHLLYVANMHVLQEAAEQNNAERMRELLDETAAYPARGFEWYYWQRQMHLELKTLYGHSTNLCSVAFSPDGQRIVTGSSDGTAKVWDAAGGKELLTLKGNGAGIQCVAFSPDGERIETGNGRTAKVWDAASGKPVLTLSPSGSILAFSPDGERIATGNGRTAKVWDAANGKELLTLKGHTNDVTSVAFAPNGQRIVTGSRDGTAQVWDATNGKPRLTLLTLTRVYDPVTSVAFSPDGQRIVTGSQDGTAKVWDAANGKELLTLKGHSGWINSVAFFLNGQRIVTGSWDGTAKVWETASGKELLTLKGHARFAGAGQLGVLSVAVSPDGQRIVNGFSDGTAKVWEMGSRKEVLTLNEAVQGVAFSPDGERILTGSPDGTAKVWEVATGKELLTIKGYTNPVNSVAFSPDGRRIVMGSEDHTARVWDVTSGSELFALGGHSDVVFCVAFSSDSQRIATGSIDQTAKLWDAASGNELITLRGHSSMINSVAFSPDGQRIVTGGDDLAKVWDAASGKLLLTLVGPYQSQSVAFSPDGQRIVTGSLGGTAIVWDATSGTNLFSFKGHNGWINSVAFSPDGQRIVTGSADGTAKLWEAASGKELLTFKGHGAIVTCVAFSPDGQRIVTGSWDHTARVWEAATPQRIAAWEQEEKEGQKRLAVLRPEKAAAAQAERAVRAQAPGAIKQWLVLAPIAFAGRTAEAGLRALDQEHIAQEANLRPRDGERVKVGESERVWRKVQLEDYLLDFNKLTGEQTEWSVAYAVCYIQSEAAQTGLLMKVGSDDQAKVYLNGKEIYRCEEARACELDQDVVPRVELKAGLNVVVFKVVNETGGWQGSVRFTDASSQPIKGIRVTLDPDASNDNRHQ